MYKNRAIADFGRRAASMSAKSSLRLICRVCPASGCRCNDHHFESETSGKASDEQDGQQGHPWDDKRSEFFFFHNGITALRCATR
jgi:hypothetical protein